MNTSPVRGAVVTMVSGRPIEAIEGGAPLGNARLGERAILIGIGHGRRHEERERNAERIRDAPERREVRDVPSGFEARDVWPCEACSPG
jgi:hypothetical protein